MRFNASHCLPSVLLGRGTAVNQGVDPTAVMKRLDQVLKRVALSLRMSDSIHTVEQSRLDC